MPPRVFLSKSAEAIENKGREPGKELQESSRVRKLKEVEEISLTSSAVSMGVGWFFSCCWAHLFGTAKGWIWRVVFLGFFLAVFTVGLGFTSLRIFWVLPTKHLFGH